MRELKKVSLALAALFGVSAVANAAIYEAEPAPIVGCDTLSVACDEPQGLIFGAQYVGLVDTTGDFLPKSNSLASSVFLELGWQFEQGIDVTANWLGQFDKTTTRNPSFDSYDPTGWRVKDEHHIVNLEIGKTVHAGPRTNMRFHLGAQYLNIQRNLNDPYFSYIGRRGFNWGTAEGSAKQEFNGFGPRGGFDGEYWFNEWFAVDGAIAVSVLVGDAKTSGSVFNFSADWLPNGPITRRDFRSTVRTVTAGIDGRLGAKVDLSKTHPSMQHVPLEIVGGYRWHTYTNVLNNNINFIANRPDFPDFERTLAGQGHFGAHGFYVGARTKIAKDMFDGWLA